LQEWKRLVDTDPDDNPDEVVVDVYGGYYDEESEGGKKMSGEKKKDGEIEAKAAEASAGSSVAIGKWRLPNPKAGKSKKRPFFKTNAKESSASAAETKKGGLTDDDAASDFKFDGEKLVI
jgi:hypothetical protein